MGGAVIFISKAAMFVGGAIIFIGKRSLAVEGRLFKIAGARVANNIKGVNKCGELKQRLIIYKLKGPLVLINSLISTFNHSVRLSS